MSTLQEYRSSTQDTLETAGRRCIDFKTELLIFLWYIANKVSIRDVADRFGVCEASVLRIRNRLCNMFIDKVMKKVIKFPDVDKCRETANQFPGVVGAIDGTHIRIPRPVHDGDQFFNRKVFYSFNTQVMCDFNLEFIDVFTGFPGRVHDARVFHKSPIPEFLSNLPNEFHILGDAAYPLLINLLTPFREISGMPLHQTKYNKIHSRARQVVERSIGILKGRFRKLKDLEMVNLEMMCKVIISACCVHNIVIKSDSNERLYEYFAQGENDEIGFRRGDNASNQLDKDLDAADKRTQIARDLVRERIN